MRAKCTSSRKYIPLTSLIILLLLFLCRLEANSQNISKTEAHGHALNLYFNNQLLESYDAFTALQLEQFTLPINQQDYLPYWGRIFVLNDLGMYSRSLELLDQSDSTQCGIVKNCFETRNIERIKALFGQSRFEECHDLASTCLEKTKSSYWPHRYKCYQYHAQLYLDPTAIKQQDLDSLKPKIFAFDDEYFNLDYLSLEISFELLKAGRQDVLEEKVTNYLTQSEGLSKRYAVYEYLDRLTLYLYDHPTSTSTFLNQVNSSRIRLYKELNLGQKTEWVMRKEHDFQLAEFRLIQAERNSKLVEIQTLALKRQQLIYWLGFSFLCASIISLILFYVIRKKNKLRLELAIAHEELARQNIKLEEAVAIRTGQLEAKLEEFREFSFLNSHKLRLPFAEIAGLIQAYKTKGEPQFLDFLPESLDRAMKVIGEISRTISKGKLDNLRSMPVLAVKSVLLVDDDQLQNLTNEAILKSCNPGIQISAYLNPSAALENLYRGKEKPDLIFLDIMMPEMNGFQFLQKLTDAELMIPTVVLSSSINPEDKKEAMSFENVMEFVEKPLPLKWAKDHFSHKE